MALDITSFTFNPFQEKTYVLWDETGECVVVDAGNYSAADDRALTAFISEKGLKPVAALNTHGHIDHILGVPYVMETYDVPFVLHGDDRFLVDSAEDHARMYGFRLRGVPQVGRDLKGAEEFRFGNTVLKVIHTPGHTPGHVCFYEAGSKVLFSGDTLFRESIGRTDLPGGDYSWIMRSILEKLIPLGGDVTLYPGHGPQSTIGHETLYNPFIVEVLQGDVNYR